MEQTLFPNIVNFLSQCYPFNELPSELVRSISTTVEISYLIQGEQIPEQECVTGLYCVRTGAVEQRYSNGSLRARLGTSDVFGFSHLDHKAKSKYAVTAIENTLLYRIPIPVLDELIKNHPEHSNIFASKPGQRLVCKNYSSSMNDNELFLKPISSIVNTGMAKVTPETTIQDTAKEMVSQHRSSALVMEEGKLLGIVSDRDMTKRVVSQGIDIQAPIKTIMTKDPCTIENEAPIISAIELMMQKNVRSLPVVDKGKIIGVVTATSLVAKSSIQAVYLVSRIYRQESIEDLKTLSIQRQSIFEALIDGGIHPRRVQQMMTLIADAFNKRLLQLAEKELGQAPMLYVWFIAGSQARNEINYTSDQDNGLILERTPNKEEKTYFSQLAEFVCYGLEACGYVLCPGHMMATNPKWSQSLESWCHYYQTWILTPETEALLNISVFLDIRFLYGDKKLFNELLTQLKKFLVNNKRFYRVLVANSLRVNPPLGMFRQFVLAKDGENRHGLNIKKSAINLIIELARIYALSIGYLEPNTEDRLKEAAKAGIISQESFKELLNAFYFLCQVRYTCQRDALLKGEPTNNDINPDKLTQFDRNHLKDAFRIISTYQESALLTYDAKGALA